MRMPIFTYFLVVGSVLTGLLVWFGENREFEGAPMKTSQTIGVPKPSMPFKSKPDSRAESILDLTSVNFAAARERPAAERVPEKPAKVAAEPKPRQKTVVRSWAPPAGNAWFAAYPQNNWMSFR